MAKEMGAFRSGQTHEDEPDIAAKAEEVKQKYLDAGDTVGAARLEKLLKFAHVTGLDPNEIMRQITELESRLDQSQEKKAA